LGIFQETATEAAEELHVSRLAMLEKYHAFWMLARIWYRLDRPLFWGDRIAVQTWHRPARGVSMYRDFDLFVDGQKAGEAISVWVLADVESRKLVRLSRLTETVQTDGGELCKQKTLNRICLPEGDTQIWPRPLYDSDTDINGHVNNTRYADFVCDALHWETRGEGCFVSEMQVGFLKECQAGETLSVAVGQDGGIWYAHGAGPDGDSRFDASLVLSPLPERRE